MPAAGELTSARGRCGAYALLGAAARWLGWLNGIGALVGVGFSLGVLGADVAPPDLTMPVALFLAGVIACAGAMLCWGLAQVAASAGRPARRCVTVAVWLGVAAYIASLLAFAAGCWLSAGLAADAAGDPMGAVYAARAAFF